MKLRFHAMILAAVLASLGSAVAEPGRRLAVTLEPRWVGAPLTFDALTNQTAAGQLVSVTRLDFLLANVALRRTDGAWLGVTNWFAYLGAREGRTSFELNNLPGGTYDRVRFQVGVPPAFNHANPAGFAAAHPLNPNVNGLHWNWQGGYVFFALEGNWRTLGVPDSAGGGSTVAGPLPRPNASDPPGAGATNAPDGYSYHVATDRLLMTVELPIALELSADHELCLGLNVDCVFAARHTIRITDDTSSTHSREADPLAAQLRDNIESAFTVEGLRTAKPAPVPGTNHIEIARDATPYPLTISRFFPRPALPLDNPLTEEGVELGRHLFHDPRLSINDGQSCATCHQVAAGFVDAGQRFSPGAEGRVGDRNTMPLFNLAWKNSFFWDGRAPSLRTQVLMPIENPLEMHETLTNVVVKLRSTVKPGPGRGKVTSAENDYPALFARAFGSPDITPDRLARALEQFLLTQVSHASKFDRVLTGQATLTADEQRGFELFNTEYDPRRGQFGADCFHCHGGPLFQSQSFANNGLDVTPADPGRFLVTGQPGDRGKFAVPSLRNVAVTGPYMHDGRFADLDEVIAHYATGVKRSQTLDPNLAKHPGGGVPLVAADQRALAAFLRTLTDARFLNPVP